jgi:hydroxyethylthiazole kinase
MSNVSLALKAALNLQKLRATRPLIHNITNYVVMNYTANALLSCGASPVMAHAVEEVEEMVSMAGALVLNIGTLTPAWIDAMLVAGKEANRIDIPVVLDPVGSGATKLRTRSAKRILEEVTVSVIRGNASEVLSLAETESGTKGVDSVHSVEDVSEIAVGLANKLGLTLAITGQVDLITDGNRIYRVSNGHELMSRVTGTGCTASALVGAFLAVDRNVAHAATTALSYLGLAGERAAATATGPGSFQMAMLDALYTLKGKEMEKGAKIQA